MAFTNVIFGRIIILSLKKVEKEKNKENNKDTIYEIIML